jgi:hypothetical protein
LGTEEYFYGYFYSGVVLERKYSMAAYL